MAKSTAATRSAETKTKDGAARAQVVRTARPRRPQRTLDLQRRMGNRAAAQLLALAQPKLTVGPAGDEFEHEADAVAAQVVAVLQGGNVNGNALAGAAAADAVTPDAPIARSIQRRTLPGASNDGGSMDPELENRIQSARSGGSPLDARTRGAMEQSFGTSFGDVRIHTGANSTQLNRSIDAKAFTIGSDIFFNGAKPDTSSRDGQMLLAHELTHTVQQRGSSSAVQRWSLFGKSKPETEGQKAKKGEDQERKRLKAEKEKGSQQREQMKGTVGKDPEALKALNKRFAAVLEEEKKLRAVLAQHMPPEEAETRAYKEVWLDAPEDLRAIRPMRETGSEKLLGKTTELRTDQGVAKQQEQQREQEKGSIVSKKVEALLLEELELVKKKMLAGEPESRAKVLAYTEMERKTDPELWAKRPPKGGKVEAAAMDQLKKRLNFEKMMQSQSSTLDTVSSIGQGSMAVTGGIGKGVSKLEDDGNKKTLSTGEMAGDGMSSISSMISDIFKTISAVKGVMDRIDKETLQPRDANDIGLDIKAGLAVLDGLNSAVADAMKIAGALSESALASVADMLPIVDVISNSIALAAGIAEVVPNAMRYGSNVGDLYLARVAKKSEMVLIAKRLGQRNAQLFEKSVVKTLAAATKLALGIAQVATAGADFGASTALKYTVKGLEAAHDLGHMIADNVFAVQAKNARKKVVGREEGGAEELLRRDAAFAVDGLITAALKGDKKQQFLAKEALKSGYNITLTDGNPKEVAMAHERILSILQESDNPKTTLDKINDGIANLKATAKGMSDKATDVRTLAEARNETDGGDRGFFWRMKMWFKSEGALKRRIVQHNLEHGTNKQTAKQKHADPITANKAPDAAISLPNQDKLIKQMEGMSKEELQKLIADKKTPELMRMVYEQALKEKIAAEISPPTK